MNNTDIHSLEKNTINLGDKMNVFMRLKNLFFYPSNLMSYIKNKPNIMFPMLFILLFNIGVVFLEFSEFKVVVKDILLAQLQGNESSITDGLVNMATFMSVIFSVLTLLFSVLVVTIVFFAFVKLLRGEGYFKQYLSIVVYSSIVNLIGLLILMINSMFTGKFLFSANISIFELLNIKLTSNYFSIILSYFTISNILSIWQHMIIAIGVIKISEINKRYVYLFTAFIYIISILLIH